MSSRRRRTPLILSGLGLTIIVALHLSGRFHLFSLMSQVETFLLFGALVLLPLQLELLFRTTPPGGGSLLLRAAQRAHCLAFLPLAASFLFLPGKLAAFLVIPYLVFEIIAAIRANEGEWYTLPIVGDWALRRHPRI